MFSIDLFDVILAGARHIDDVHAVFDPLLEVDVFIKADVGPVVGQLDLGVG